MKNTINAILLINILGMFYFGIQKLLMLFLLVKNIEIKMLFKSVVN